jgi:hypothetical protein
MGGRSGLLHSQLSEVFDALQIQDHTKHQLQNNLLLETCHDFLEGSKNSINTCAL